MSHTLSEAASKALLAGCGVPVAPERLVDTPAAASEAAAEFGYPVVAKLCGDHVAHKTERGLVRLNLADAPAVEAATADLLAAARPEDAVTGVLVAPMVSGSAALRLRPIFIPHRSFSRPTVLNGSFTSASQRSAWRDVVTLQSPFQDGSRTFFFS
jgi:acyl-CoA synthetase (NDP forming)